MHGHSKKENKLKNWLHSYWKHGAVALAVLVGGASVYALTSPEGPNIENRSNDKTASTDEEPPEPTTVPAPLRGHEVEPEEASRPITGVLIENSPNARPQTGLDSADIVFEAVSEGGITRYLALYQYDIPQTTGPIRSMRPYFVDWVMGFDAPIAHVGGSPEALRMLSNRNAKDLDQFDHSGPYSRSGDRPAPHNMYANMDQLRNLQNDLGFTDSNIKDFAWQDGEPAEEPNATSITVDFSSSQYQARFDYSRDSNSYSRYLAGQSHIDAGTNAQISVDNLIVAKMNASQDGQYTVLDNIGSGEALVFNNGNVTGATWRQSSYDDRFEILDEDGNTLPLNRGSSWISILPADRTVSY